MLLDAVNTIDRAIVSPHARAFPRLTDFLSAVYIRDKCSPSTET